MSVEEKLKGLFKKFDSDNNGSLSLCELTAALAKEGYPESNVKVRRNNRTGRQLS